MASTSRSRQKLQSEYLLAKSVSTQPRTSSLNLNPSIFCSPPDPRTQADEPASVLGEAADGEAAAAAGAGLAAGAAGYNYLRPPMTTNLVTVPQYFKTY